MSQLDDKVFVCMISKNLVSHQRILVFLRGLNIYSGFFEKWKQSFQELTDNLTTRVSSLPHNISVNNEDVSHSTVIQ